jgi:serine phosphatase RsbU (regulator of sigma subunit)
MPHLGAGNQPLRSCSIDLLERFASSVSPADAPVISAVRDYVAWQTERRDTEFVPTDDDDVDLRSYLLHLRASSNARAVLDPQIAALTRFYLWMKTERVIGFSPFDQYNLFGESLASTQPRLRPEARPSDPLAREVARLSGLGQIAEQLNTSADVQSALDGTLKTVLQVMGLQTGWVSMLTESPIRTGSYGVSPPHGFTLVAACGLPPGLERDDRRFLRQPPACHCQRLLVEGKLTRALNIIECARLRDSARAAGDNRGLLFHASVPLVSQGKPLGLINVATAEWSSLARVDLEFLSAVSGQVVIALERAHLYDVAETQRAIFARELQVAHEVQASLLPHTLPVIPGFGFAGAWRPARVVAGDFYDIFPMAEGRWGIVIGDVADKGTGAVLYMAMARSLILSGALRHSSPAAVLVEVNRTILMQYSAVMFVSVFLAVLDPQTHTLTYANAGHNPPILRQASGSQRPLTRTGPVVGALEELQLSETTIQIGRGDALLMYTDGVTEARDPLGEQYGEERLKEAVAAAPQKASDLLRHVEADLAAFTRGALESDDVTFFVLNRD